MCVERLEEDNNIVNVNTIEISKLAKLFVHYSLNVDEQIFEFYNSDIKLFLVSINNEEKLMFIFKRNQELQEESQLVHQTYVPTITNLSYNVRLNKYRMSICNDQSI